MAWTIPLGELAGALAVTFTAGSGTGMEGQQAPAEGAPPVQRPSSDAGPGPSSDPGGSDPADPVAAPVDGGPRPPALPPATPAPATEGTLVPPPPGDAATMDGGAAAPTMGPGPETSTVSDPVSDGERPPAADGSLGGSSRLLRPTDKRRFFQMSINGATARGGYFALYGGSVDVQIEGAIGTHSRRKPEFGGGFVVQYRRGFFSEVSLAGRFQWDKPLSKAFALYSAFDTTIGLNVPLGYGGYLYPSIPAAQIGVGWGVKTILAERFMLLMRPIAPNLIAPDFFSSPIPVQLRWDFGMGIGVVW